ncbi:MAG: transcription elongation factor GreA, partial [Dehalococcoidia bacterium]|nr:transcription elongation factor GreA [Dehalococcoidia bacterium]
MDDKPVFLTVEGLAKLESELDHLRRIRRAEIAARINDAQEVGGFGDNADLDDARNEQAFVEARIQTLERMLRNAKIIKEGAGDTSVVHIGSKVTVLTADGDEETYTIV